MEYEVIDGDKRMRMTSFNKAIIYCLAYGCPALSLAFLIIIKIFGGQQDVIYLDGNLFTRQFSGFDDIWNNNFIKGLQFFSVEESSLRYDKNLPNPPPPSPDVCSAVSQNEKFDCFPRGSVTQDACTKRGCCYVVSSGKNQPFCFFPPNFKSYSYSSINKTDKYMNADMTLNYNLPYPNAPPKITLMALFEKDDSLLIVITDLKKKKELTKLLDHFGAGVNQLGMTGDALYDVKIENNTIGFQIIRKSTNTSLFDTQGLGGLTYSDQFIQITAKVPCKHIYGLGEGRTDMPLSVDWNTRTLWNHDTIPTNGINGYGSYPMYMCSEGNGLAHIATFLNFYATDFVLQPGSLTYRTIGTPLVIRFSLGPSPVAAVQQAYSGMKLNSIMPPYWGLGFHLCRFGYKSLEDIKSVWNATRAAGIPYDTQWVDIDYMRDRNDFTLSPKFKGLGSFVNMLHELGMHFVPILDPGVSGSEPKGSYPPYDRGVELDIFIKDSKGKYPLKGKVWNNNTTVFPDFSNPKAVPYWIEMIQSLYKVFQFDGLWIDMNEPSNLVDGSLTGCPNNNLEQPPYVPSVDGASLISKTICMSAKHYVGPHYQVHNFYGLQEAAITSFALTQIRGKRPFVISRASTLSIGNYAGHWTGDVVSSWEDMAQSVKDIIHMSMYGVNLVGADICGFNGNTTAKLCERWHQLGAFYPFSRNHNTDDAVAQDPVSMNIVASTKKALLLRYSLLPYLYTLFWHAKMFGKPVIRPLFYLFPEDEAAYTVNSQFMWGDGLLIAPVLQEDLTYVKAYLGKSIWYDIYTNDRIISNSSQPYALAAPEDTIPVLVRGGTVLVMQEPDVTTTLSRKNPFFLKVALNESNHADGMLYWDDGETLDGSYSTIYFGIINNTLMNCNDIADYKFDLIINRIEIFSLDSVSKVTLNQQPYANFTFSKKEKVLTVNHLDLQMQKDFNLTWFY